MLARIALTAPSILRTATKIKTAARIPNLFTGEEAERLGVPFLDRAIPVAVATMVGIRSADPLLREMLRPLLADLLFEA